MKPYPLASLNHFTVPCSAILLLFPFQSIYAVRSEVLRAVQAGMQEAAQQPILIKRLFSLSEKAIFRWLNCLCRLRREDAFGNHLPPVRPLANSMLWPACPIWRTPNSIRSLSIDLVFCAT